MEPDLVTIGDLMVDVSVDTDVFAHGGHAHGRIHLRPGGSAANAAVWAASDGASTRVIGRVGADAGGRMIREALKERRVDLGVAEDPEAPTGTMLTIRESGKRSIVADPGANARLSPDDLPDRITAGAVLVSGYTLLQKSSERAALAALERADAEHVAVDAASWSLLEAYGIQRFFRATERATWLLANEREAEVLTGESADGAADVLRNRYRNVCVKLGPEGAILWSDGRAARVSGPAVKDVDATGAGDAFAGVLLSRVARGDSPEDALGLGCNAGIEAVSVSGTWPP